MLHQKGAEAPAAFLNLIIEPRRVAASKLAKEAPGQTLKPTALANDPT
jgi:hypothetical protein